MFFWCYQMLLINCYILYKKYMSLHRLKPMTHYDFIKGNCIVMDRLQTLLAKYKEGKENSFLIRLFIKVVINKEWFFPIISRQLLWMHKEASKQKEEEYKGYGWVPWIRWCPQNPSTMQWALAYSQWRAKVPVALLGNWCKTQSTSAKYVRLPFVFNASNYFTQ